MKKGNGGDSFDKSPAGSPGGSSRGRSGQPGHGVHKEFPLTNFAIAHRTSVLVGTLIVLILGTVAYMTLPKEAAPEIEVPFLLVGTLYPGVSPQDIETLITRPIEEELNDIADVKEITNIIWAVNKDHNTGCKIAQGSLQGKAYNEASGTDGSQKRANVNFQHG